MMNEIIEKALGIIRNEQNAYIGSVDEHGYPNIKAMQVRGVDDDLKTIYFSTAANTVRVQQYKNNPLACVYFSDTTNYKGVMLIGTMEVTTDKAAREQVWRKGDDFYYPQGIDDPMFNVLKFHVKSGRTYGAMESNEFIIK